MVRTPALDAALVMKLLDAGALGIICAHVDTPEQARALVNACRYPPVGQRGVGPVRANIPHSDYLNAANELVNVFAVIESASAVTHLDSMS